MKPVEIICRGRCVPVTEEELSDVRAGGFGWLAYCQQRLDKGHDKTMAYFATFPRYAEAIAARMQSRKDSAMKFQPTEAQKKAARNTFVAMAVVETIRPIVEGYQKAILAEGQWRIQPKYAATLGNEVILDPSDTYLMATEDFVKYRVACNSAREAAGLHVPNEEWCPLLLAQHVLVKAQRALLEAMEPVTNLSPDRLLNAGLETYKEGVELTLRLLGQFVESEDVRKFIRCEESNLGVLHSLGAHFGAYDHAKGGVEAILGSDALEQVAKYPADFRVEPVASHRSRTQESAGSQARSERTSSVDSPAP